MSFIEGSKINKVFRDYDMSFGKSAALAPFHEEVKNLEDGNYKIGSLANLFSLFFIPTQSDPEGAILLQKMQQIPMAEIFTTDGNETCNRILIFLRNINEQKAVVSVTVDDKTGKNVVVEISGDAWKENPEFQYVTGLLFSEVGPFSHLPVENLLNDQENYTELLQRGSRISK